MKIFVDIDGTIFTRRLDLNYEKSEPIPSRIKKLNSLYNEGHEIIYWTARGTTSKIDYKELTEKQLEKFGVKFSKLILGKPEYDIFIDDKNVNALVLEKDNLLQNLKSEIELNHKLVNKV